MGERFELGDLQSNQYVNQGLLDAIQRSGTEQLVNYFRAPVTQIDTVVEGYRKLFSGPTCGQAELMWRQALSYRSDQILYGSHAYESIEIDVRGVERWVRDFEPTKKSILLKNPMNLFEMQDAVGVTNTLFAHEGIVFIGKYMWPTPVVQSIRPIRLKWQGELLEKYRSTMQNQEAND